MAPRYPNKTAAFGSWKAAVGHWAKWYEIKGAAAMGRGGRSGC